MFLFLCLSCTEEEQKEKCVFSDGNISPNFKLIWMDTSIVNEEYPEMDTILIRFEDNTDKIVNGIMEDLYLYTEGWVNWPNANSSEAAKYRRLNLSPITFRIEIEKDKNKKNDSFLADVWVTDENCNDYQKASVPFYKYKETDSSYIFTTQLIENGEYVAGCPIFLIGGIKNITNNRDNLILLDAAEDYYSVATPFWEKLVAPKRRINIEINVNFDATIKDTLKTFVNVFPISA